MKGLYRAICGLLAVVLFASVLSGCTGRKGDKEKPPSVTVFECFRDIPGVTEEEIKAIEALQRERASFVYGALVNAEAFVSMDGEIRGFAALFTEWMSGLFDIPFELRHFTWANMNEGLASFEIDFVGNLAATPERHQILFMTSAIARRSVKYMRLPGSESIAEISQTREPRLALLGGSATVRRVTSVMPEGFKPVLVDEYCEAYELMLNGTIDALVAESNNVTAFDGIGDVVTEYFFPILVTPVTLATQNPANKPIIDVMQKALDNGVFEFLRELYVQGFAEYESNKFISRLSQEQRAFIKNNPVIRYGAENGNYPLSYFSHREGNWQGIAQDVLKEVTRLSGIRFEPANEPSVEWPDLLEMLRQGEVPFVTELLRTESREGYFLWPENHLLSTHSVLISKAEHPNINFYDVFDVKVGLARGSGHAEMFWYMFPHHENAKEFESSEVAFNALVADEVDMIMHSGVSLVRLTHYRELPGYKANIVFDNAFYSTFGFNTNDAVLLSVIDAAMDIIDVGAIAQEWLGRTFDNRIQMQEARQEAQLPWIVGAASLLLITISILAMLYSRGRQKSKTIAEQSSMLTAIYDTIPAMVFTKSQDKAFTTANRLMLQEIQLDSNELLLGKVFSDIMPFEKSVMGVLSDDDDKVINEGITLEREDWFIYPGNIRKAKQIIKTPLIRAGRPTGLLGVVVDITQRKIAEEALHEALQTSESALNSMINILNTTDAMIYVTELDSHKILFVNDSMKKHFNIDYDAVGLPCYEVFNEGLTERCEWCPCYHLDESPEDSIVWNEHNTMTKRHYMNTDRYIDWPGGKKVHMQFSVDITDIKRTQEILEANQRVLYAVNNVAKTLLTAEPGDDFKNSLQASMETIGRFVDTDCIELWKNEIVDGRTAAVLTECWHSPAGKVAKEGTDTVLYYDESPNWEERFLNGEHLNGPIAKMSPDDYEYLKPFNIVSAMVFPIFISNKLWGFCCIDDCTKEDIFTEDEKDILHSVNLMMASMLNQHALAAAVAKNHEYTRMMLDTSPICTQIWNKKLETVDCNLAAVELYGFKSKQEYAERFVTDCSPEFQPCGRRSDEKAVELVSLAFRDGFWNGEWLHQMPDGSSLIPAEVTLVRVESKGEQLVMGYTRDLRKERALTRRIEALINNLPGMVYRSRYNPPEFTFEYISDGVLDLMGYTPEEYLQMSFLDVVHPDDVERIKIICDETLALGLPMETFYRVVARDGKEKLIWERCRVVENLADGSESYIEGYCADVTERQELEMAEAASKAKSQFLAVMSHEIRTPMGSIMGFAELAMDSVDTTPQVKGYLGKIIDSTKWLLNITNDILDISKVEAGRMELENVPFDLRDVVSRCQSVMLPAAAEKGLVLKVAAQTAALENKRLLGDPVRLYQALLNLLSNAIKFTPQGEIELSVLAKALPDNKIGADFAIRDTGIGMTPEQASRIYEPFVQADSSTTRNYGGSGLGLTITKNIVELMGGKLTLESTYGIGSTFTANIVFDAIDISDSGDDAGFTKPAVPVKPFFDARILVVDDNSMNQQVIAEHLSSVGIKTVVAGNGKEGIDKVKERIFKGEAPFDLIFMDIYMPIMDGIEASQEIAALGIGTPVIAVTANVMSSDLEKYRRYGMPDCLGKPFTSQELWSLLLKYLTPVAKVADEGGDYSPVHQEKMHQKMRYHFIRNNENIFENICAAIETQDVKATHRMLHTLKSNAGLIGEARLQKIAQEMESMFTNGMIANGIMPVFGDYLGLLRAESKRVISDLRPLLELSLSGARLKSDEPLSIEQIKELVDKLEPLLKKRNTECLNLLDDIRNVPEMEELANQMERYDFRLALGTLGQLKIDWGFGDGQSPEV